MASVVRAMRIEGLTAPTTPAPPAPRKIVDPVCGMTVAVGPDTPHRTIEGVEHWYCSAECRDH